MKATEYKKILISAFALAAVHILLHVFGKSYVPSPMAVTYFVVTPGLIATVYIYRKWVEPKLFR